MSKTLLPLREVKAALKSVKDEAYSRGVEAGRAEATRMLEFAVRLNGHGPRTLKAILGEDDATWKQRAILDRPDSAGRGGAVMPESTVEPAPPASDLILLAYIDALTEAKEHHPDGDGGTIAEYLRGLLHDPEEAAAFVASLSDDGVSLKAFDESKHPRGDDGRFIGREAIHAAKSDPAKAEALRARTTDPAERAKLDAALEGKEDLGRTKAGLHKEKVEQTKKEKVERIQKVRTLAEEISMARRGGEPVPPEHYTELAAELPHLTRDQLRSVRTSLAASFWGRTRRDEMVTALVRHAKVKAEQLRAERASDDPLDFSMEAMSNTGGTGHADAGRSELNPWREFDKADDKRFGEAQHGGRIEQRQNLMAELPASDKTSHGTPDLGSKLKHPDKMLDVRTLDPENVGDLTLDQQVKKPDEPTAKQVTKDTPGERGDWGDSLEPDGERSGHTGGGTPDTTAANSGHKPDPTILRESHLPGRAGAMYTGGVGGLDKFAEQVGLPSDFYEDHRVTHSTKNGAEISGVVAINPKYDPDGKVEAAIDKRDDARRRGLYEGQRKKFYDQQVADAWRSVTSEIGAKDTAESPEKQAAPTPALTQGGAKEAAQAVPQVTPEQAEARKWKKNEDGTYTAPNGVVWKKAAAGGEVSPVTGEMFKGGSLMPIHGKSQGGLEVEGEGGEGGSKVGAGGKPEKRKPPQAPKPSRGRQLRDINGNLVPVPEGHMPLESIVGGSPMKSHMLSDETLASTLGITRKQANDLKAIYESGAVSIPKEALPPSSYTRGHVPSDDWDIAAKLKEISSQQPATKSFSSLSWDGLKEELGVLEDAPPG